MGPFFQAGKCIALANKQVFSKVINRVDSSKEEQESFIWSKLLVKVQLLRLRDSKGKVVEDEKISETE